MKTIDEKIDFKFLSNRSPEQAAELYNQRILDAKATFDHYWTTFTSRTCPSCNQDGGDACEKFLDRYEVKKCRACGCSFCSPCPSLDALQAYYKNSETSRIANAILKLRTNQSPAGTEKPDQRILAIAKHCQILPRESEHRKISLCEIGANSGHFLAKLRRFIRTNFKTTELTICGVDLDDSATKVPAEENLNLFCDDASQFLAPRLEEFDVIAFFELLEHLINPMEFLKRVHQSLKVGGLAVLTTPNIDGLEALALPNSGFRPIAHPMFPPMHLNAFSQTGLRILAMRTGFDIEELSTPGTLDMDLMYQYKSQLSDPLFEQITNCDEKTRHLMQELVARLNGSSHMLAVLRKRKGGPQWPS